MTRRLAIALALVLFAPPAIADEPSAMQATADGFYRVYRGFHPSDGIPDVAGRAKYRPFLSPRLDALLEAAGNAQAGFAAKYKNSPPLLEGDIFSSLFEGATAVSVDGCVANGEAGRCMAHLRHASPGDKPSAWDDTVYLVNTPAGWRVDDIGYGGGWDFANKGRLSETLSQAIHFQ